MNKKSRKLRMGVSFLILFCAFIYSKNSAEINSYISKIIPINYTYAYSIENIPEYTNKEYIIINNNEPYFTEEDYTLKSFEKYSDLDLLGRCGVAYANVGIDTMPTTERGSIGMIKPTGWHTIKYDIVNGKYLYNRCHLIGYQLTGENDNEKNLITCTRQMNIGPMLEYENKVADYVKKTNNHVLYRVTPVFKDSNLLATGVEIEAYSVEDNGEGIKFNVFIYNVQEGIEIDYTTGDSKLK
ncbi:MAG: DNA/RNA non-specific endonuclease [Bacteroidales bacterium]|nr:DNA/RNA non-specific endonuclease [Bacteroidales bacterium]